MVYFTCNHCGGSLKKSNVEKHHNGQCRSPIFVTCMDCMKDFRGEAYIAHTKCITEDEKYSAKGFVSRPASFKGEAKQNAWLELVKNVSESCKDIPTLERSLLSSLIKHDNIPQKKAKFQNFAKNVWNPARYHPKVVDFVWNLIETQQRAQKEAKSGNEGNLIKEKGGKSNGFDNDEPQKNELSTKKRKHKHKGEKYETKVVEMEGEKKENGMLSSAEISNESISGENGVESNGIGNDVHQKKKLSSKEKKKKRKREKYEAELLEVEGGKRENGVGNSIDEGTNVEESIQKKQPKSKAKRDKHDAKVHNMDVDDNENQEIKIMNGKQNMKTIENIPNKKNMVLASEIETTTLSTRSHKSKKKRKNMEDELVSDENQAATKKSKLSGDNHELVCCDTEGSVKSSKFNWCKVIVDVLESAQDQELPVKRLRKKVLAEFASTGKEVDVAARAKFEKKLSNIPVVLLLKDRAKLKIH